MTGRRHVRDPDLLDAVGDLQGKPFTGRLWRVVREGRSVFDGSRGSGRWNPAQLSVLYTASEHDGALEEIFFHLSRGQSVFPSRMRHVAYELRIRLSSALDLTDPAPLTRLGVDRQRYQEMLYDRMQEIADAVSFLGHQALIAPSARYACNVCVLFLDQVSLDDLAVVSERPVDWAGWRKARLKPR